MNALLSVLMVITMGTCLFNFDEELPENYDQPDTAVSSIEITPTPIPFEAMTLEQRAESVELTTQEFIAISNITERESNRCIPETDEDLQGRIFIALVIFNRASEEHPEFGNDIISVITQRGQFSTYRSSRDVNESTYRTEYSDIAVYEAYQWIHSGEEYPDVLFFTCRYWFSWRPRYGNSAIGGNYFSL